MNNPGKNEGKKCVQEQPQSSRGDPPQDNSHRGDWEGALVDENLEAEARECQKEAEQLAK